ncbi:MAG TPA: PilZ domain-containing protein [Kofleriaceae bacterium]|nr:PilZ domain-containing protein [Kofleriaceae bacterium]
MTRERSVLYCETQPSAHVKNPRLTDHDASTRHQPVDIPASVRVSGDELRVQTCRLHSLSLGGAFLEIERLPVGTLVNVTFRLPTADERLFLDAVVQWSSDEGVSVLFDSLRASEVWMLWRFLSSLTTDTEQEPTQRISVASLTP